MYDGTELQPCCTSGNIACEVIEAHKISLRCEIASSLQPKPPQPYAGYCPFAWGKGLLLPMSGRPEILCISDTVADPHKSILPYGSKWKNRGLKCVSEKAGLTCNNATGQGFFLSREKWRVFDKSGY